MSRRNIVSTISAVLLAAGVITVLAVADLKRFEEPEFSPLYKATLESAYSRFRENDKRVPAGEPRKEAAPSEETPGVAPASASKRIRPAKSAASRHVHSARTSAQSSGYNSPEMKRGNEFAAKKEYDKALAAFREQLKKYPQSALAWHRIGDVLGEQGKSEEAIAAYREALKIQPNFYCCYGHIGDLLLKEGKKEEAEKDFEIMIAGLRKQAKGEGKAAVSAKYELAKFFVDHHRNNDEAMRLAEEAAAANPEQVAYLIPLVTAYQRAGKNKEAVSTIDRILKLKPEFEVYYKKLRARLEGAAGGSTAPQKP